MPIFCFPGDNNNTANYVNASAGYNWEWDQLINYFDKDSNEYWEKVGKSLRGTWPGVGCPCPSWALSWVIFRVPSNPAHSIFLWFWLSLASDFLTLIITEIIMDNRPMCSSPPFHDHLIPLFTEHPKPKWKCAPRNERITNLLPEMKESRQEKAARRSIMQRSSE